MNRNFLYKNKKQEVTTLTGCLRSPRGNVQNASPPTSYDNNISQTQGNTTQAKRILGREGYKTTTDIYTHLGKKHGVATPEKPESKAVEKKNVAKLLPGTESAGAAKGKKKP